MCLREILHQHSSIIPVYLPPLCRDASRPNVQLPGLQIGDQGHLYAGSSSSNGDSEASTSASAVVFIEDTHKAGGGALVVHHGRLESGDLHVGQMVSCIPKPRHSV